MKRISRIVILGWIAALASCAQAPQQAGAPDATTVVTIFSINDFHGNLQSEKPVPFMASDIARDPHGHGAGMAVPGGGYAYLSALLKQRRQAAGASILVGAGDLMGASPLGSALLRDEPVIAALNQLGLEVSAVGNHEFDRGAVELKDKLQGKCPADGCKFPGFSGARYDYLAANVSERDSGRPFFKPYVMRQVGPAKIAFIGAVTADTPNLVAGDGISNLKFEDEAAAVNRVVPEILRQGADAIVLLIHEGADYGGAVNDPSYRCAGWHGPIIDIAAKLDPAISLIVSGHTHQGYTCKTAGKLVTQARSYGAYLTETRLTIDLARHRVVDAQAKNILVDQLSLSPDPEAQALVQQAAQLTAAARGRRIAHLDAPLKRGAAKDGDSALGNVIADSQLDYAQKRGAADIAFMNSGGVRGDLPSGTASGAVDVTFADLYAVQPFGTQVLAMDLTGAQILELLHQQWQGRRADEPKKLFVSRGFSYRWRVSDDPLQRVYDVQLNGAALDPGKTYRVVVNAFLADGGDGFSVFRQGTRREALCLDLEAFESYVAAHGAALNRVDTKRVQRAR